MPSPLCDHCKIPHPPLVECRDALLSNIAALMLRIGTIDRCSKCGETIYWLKHLTGKSAPYTSAGLIHFANCPFADEFRKD